MKKVSINYFMTSIYIPIEIHLFCSNLVLEAKKWIILVKFSFLILNKQGLTIWGSEEQINIFKNNSYFSFLCIFEECSISKEGKDKSELI